MTQSNAFAQLFHRQRFGTHCSLAVSQVLPFGSLHETLAVNVHHHGLPLCHLWHTATSTLPRNSNVQGAASNFCDAWHKVHAALSFVFTSSNNVHCGWSVHQCLLAANVQCLNVLSWLSPFHERLQGDSCSDQMWPSKSEVRTIVIFFAKLLLHLNLVFSFGTIPMLAACINCTSFVKTHKRWWSFLAEQFFYFFGDHVDVSSAVLFLTSATHTSHWE